MALQYSVLVRNARLDAIEATIGTAPLLQIFTGAVEADCAAVDSGTKLVEMILPTDWMANASSGSKTKLGTWSALAIAAGVAGHWRLKEATGTTCHAQGNVTITGGGGDMTVDNTNIAVNQTVTDIQFTINSGNA